MQNLTAVEKFGNSVHSSPSEAADAAWPESSEIKQCEDSPSLATIVAPATTANPSLLCLRSNTDKDTLIVSRGTTRELIGKTITMQLFLVLYLQFVIPSD